MPLSETPANPKTPAEEDRIRPSSSGAAVADENPPEPVEESEPAAEPPFRGRSSSRYVDYDTHELLEKISQYEDERRWQRIREGIWISIIAHIAFFAALYFVPRYVLHQTQVIDPFDAIKQRKDLTYLDQLPDAIKEVQKIRPTVPLKPKDTIIDRKTMDTYKSQPKVAPPPPAPPLPAPQQQPTPPQVAQLPPSVAPPVPSPQIAQEAPRPSPVPARPNFNIPQQSAADQLAQAMRDSAHNRTQDVPAVPGQPSGLGAGTQILSDTMGVDFDPYIQKLQRETQRTWIPLLPGEVFPPINKRGEVVIRVKILPNGRIMDGGMQRVSFSGDVALDRAAWGALTGSNYPPLPREFHGPYLEVQVHFTYNMD